MFFEKKNLIYFILFILLYPCASIADISNIEKKSIGYIDFQYVLKNSIPSQKLKIELEKGRELFQKTILIEEDALRAAEVQLNQKRNSVNKEVFNGLVKEFEKKVSVIQRLVQDSHQKIEKNFQISQKRIAEVIKEEVALLAKNNDIFLVLKSDSIIYAHDSLDLTLQVLDKVDKRVFEFNFENLFIKIKENINQ